jgi:hypothetical protein
MKLRILVAAAIIIGVALVPAAAWAKGAKDVTITGPGLDHPVHLDDSAGPTTVQVNRLAQATGLFDAAFGTTPSSMRRTRPAGKLGPRYRAVYELYAEPGSDVHVHQDLYPFAAAGFVSHTARGQRALRRSATGGWYVTGASPSSGIDDQGATAMLVALGAHDRPAGRVEAAHR